METATKIALELAAALTSKFLQDARYAKSACHISVIPGPRFDKLVSGMRPGEACSAFAFIERSTGDLHKAVSWGRAEPLPRFPADKLMTSMLEQADPHGVFLAL